MFCAPLLPHTTRQLVRGPVAAAAAEQGTLVDFPRSLLTAQFTMESLQLFSFCCVLSIFRHCTTLQHTAIHCNTLQHTATHCNTLQHTASRCNTLQRYGITIQLLNSDVTYCNTLQHTATRCNTPICNEERYTLQHEFVRQTEDILKS